jgi:hypothetical protein
MGIAEFDQARAFRMFGDAAFEGDGTHFVELAFGRAHSGIFLVSFEFLAGL